MRYIVSEFFVEAFHATIICYKCKLELEKYENCIQVLALGLKKFKELYESLEQFQYDSRHWGVKMSEAQSHLRQIPKQNQSACSITPPLRPPNSKHSSSVMRRINLDLLAMNLWLSCRYRYCTVHSRLVLHQWKTGLIVPLDLTNGNPYKKRFVDRPMKSPGSKVDSGSGKRNVIGAACWERLTAFTRGFSRRFVTRSFVALFMARK